VGVEKVALLSGCGKTRFEARTVPQNSLVSTAQPDKKEVFVEKTQQLGVFSYVSPGQRVPQDHPLRPLRVMTDEALRELQPRFHKLYAKTGRPSIAPEKLLRALLLQALYCA
jgi:transposase